MLALKLRDDFLGEQMPGTAISLRTNDNLGAAQRSPDYIISITYPTADVQNALRAINSKRTGRPIVLMGERGRGKSHIMALMHHAINSAEIVENWLRGWGSQLGSQELSSFEMTKGFFPISEPVHNHEYPLLWNLIFDRHPRGEYFRGQFESTGQPYPPRTLLERMFEEKPTCLILDEFQTWFTGLPEKDPRTGLLYRQWAFNFIQNLSELAKDRPDIFILVVSVLNNQNDAFQQVHRQSPVLIDFRGPTATHDRQRLLLHRLFENRAQISAEDIYSIAGAYADERFRLLNPDKSEAERERIRQEVVECWPFSPELLNLIENQILLSQVAQETRDLIRILAQIFKSRGDSVPLITAADFFVDAETGEVQSLVDAIAVQAGQEKLRQIAQQNLTNVLSAGINAPNAREIISAIWVRSMSPGKRVGGTPAELQLDTTRRQPQDDNAFRAELMLIIEHSGNIHGDQTPGGPLWIGLIENPRTKVRACAKNSKLWQPGAVATSGNTVYPGKDIDQIRDTLRHLFELELRQSPSKIIVLGPNWLADPWSDVKEDEHPDKWTRQVLLVIPEPVEGGPSGINSVLGRWLKTHVPKRRNTVRFLLLANDAPGVYSDSELVFAARCSFLCSAKGWGSDSTYRGLHQDFDRPLRQTLRSRFNRYAILSKWDFQEPANCVFEVEKITEQGNEISTAIERKIFSDQFDRNEFRTFILGCAKDADLVGSVIDDLVEPPPSCTRVTIPFIGEIRLYETILGIAAEGDIVLNVGGYWIGRRTEDVTDEDALRYIRTKASRTGQEMRQVQLGLPGSVGGGSVSGTAPVPQPTSPTTATGTGVTPQPQIPGSATQGGAGTVNESTTPITGGGTTVVDPPKPKQNVSRTLNVEDPTSGLNLSGCFEKWRIKPETPLESARINLSGLTAHQVKQILLKIPSAYKATLEVTYTEEEGA